MVAFGRAILISMTEISDVTRRPSRALIAIARDRLASDIRVARLIALLVALAVLVAAAPGFARTAPASFADLAARLTPAVVNISTSQNVAGGTSELMPQFPPGSPFEDLFKDFLKRQRKGKDQPKRRITSLGSGFIIDAAGLVVTNNHVINDADEITVILSDDRHFPAKLVGRDTKTDLALLKIDTKESLPHVAFGDSDAIRVGDWVLAIGNPFGLGNTVTAGILSARGRNINAGPYDDFLQTDAPINRGNSGGPLFDMDGKVIGINTAIFSPTGGSVGIGFAVPANLAAPVIKQLREYGRTRRGWLGVRIQTVTEDLADSLGLGKAKGALVADVTPDSPAEKAGIEVGDVILEFNGKDVPEMRELPRMVASTPIGETVDVVVLRKGERKTVQVTIAELDESQQQAAALTTAPSPREGSAMGMTFAAVDDRLRERFGLSADVEGVVVTDVDAGGSAAERGIRPGDVIREVGLDSVKRPADVVAKVAAAKKANRRSVLLLLDRGGDQRFVAVKIGKG